MKYQRVNPTQIAEAQYVGKSGVTQDCIRAVARLLCGGELFREASLITHEQHHGFVLFGQFDDVFVVKDGFTSGYPGEGPRGLAISLKLLMRHHVTIEEYEVDEKVFHRLRHSCLLDNDIDSIQSAKPVRPVRYDDYTLPFEDRNGGSTLNLSKHYPEMIPFRLIDERVLDLAIAFHEDHDRAIFAAYRRLEDVVRVRTGLTESGAKLFARAFLSSGARLGWDVPDEGEAKARANVFTAVFGAFRNVRMHREQNQSDVDALREFLLVNQLFALERLASETPQEGEDDA